MSTLTDRIRSITSAHAQDLIALGEDVWAHPERGFRELRTSGLVRDRLTELGFDVTEGLAVTGLKAVLDTGRPGPTVAVMGEMDSVVLSSHPAADPETSAVHACGHHAQVAALIGCATALRDSTVMGQLSGRIAFMAVPAEEFLDLEHREQLRQDGKIAYFGGKAELIRAGAFDDIDLSLMLHLVPREASGHALSMNGFVVKRVHYTGRPAHAGVAPDDGRNALQAAHVAIAALNAQRETYADEDAVRVNTVFGKAGDALNIIPDDVRLDTKVRARTVDAIQRHEQATDRAFCAGALALACDVAVETMPGYMPLRNCPALAETFEECVVAVAGDHPYEAMPHRGSSTDLGDVSQIMPTVHPYLGGACEGRLHGSDFRITDPERAYVTSGAVLAGWTAELLREDAACAKRILADCPPAMSRAEYLQFLESTARREEYCGRR